MGFPLCPSNAVNLLDINSYDLLEINSYNPTNPINPKWQRTTTQQLKVLEAAYRRNPKPTSQSRQILSLRIKLPLRHVEVWFQNRRAKEKTRTRKSSLTKEARNGNGAIHSIGQTQTARDDTPHEEQEQLNVSLSPPLSPPLTWDPTPASYSPSFPELLISTISYWAENDPNPNNPPPDSSTYLLPNTRSGLDWGLEDVSSVCYRPLPFTNAMQHIHSLDPFTVTVIRQDSVVDGCHQQLALHTDHLNYDVNMEELNGLSHSHSMDDRHDDMSTTAQTTTAQNHPSRWYPTSSLPGMYHSPSLLPFPYHTIPNFHIGDTSSTPSISSFDHMRNSISTPCTPLGLGGDGESAPSPLYQTCSSGSSLSVNIAGYVNPPVAQSSAASSGSFDSCCAEAVSAEFAPVSPPSFKFSPKTPTPVEVGQAAVPQTSDRSPFSAYFDRNLELLPENPQWQATSRRQPCS